MTAQAGPGGPAVGLAAGPQAAAADRPLPAFFAFQAPAHWRTIDFISDLHLASDMPRTVAALEQHLHSTPADAVFILGDLFELWVGDDARTLPFGRRCADMLAAASRRLALAMMVGNRDFLLGAAMLHDCGASALPDPTLLSAWGQRFLLTHGDALCLADRPYIAFRNMVRDPAWQQAFLSRPLEQRLQIATDLRRASDSRRAFDGDAGIDIDPTEAGRWLHAVQAATLVHGHTHRPGSAPIAPGLQRHVLSDWDLDHPDGPARAEVLRLARDGFVRLPPGGG